MPVQIQGRLGLWGLFMVDLFTMTKVEAVLGPNKIEGGRGQVCENGSLRGAKKGSHKSCKLIYPSACSLLKISD